MKSNQLLKGALMFTAGLMLSTAAGHAALFYHVSINTSSLTTLPNSSNGPFSLDFQFNGGGTEGNNSVTIGNFNYHGGSATGTAFVTPGATGDIGSTVSLNDSGYNELYQTFIPGSLLEFDVNLTNNPDSITPDSFAISILDGGLANIPTTGIGNSLVQLDLNTGAVPNLAAGTGNYSGATASVVPEPSSAICGALAIGLGMLRRRRAA